MEERTCYLGDQTMTKVSKITRMSSYFQKNYLSEVEQYLTYLRSHRNKTKD